MNRKFEGIAVGGPLDGHHIVKQFKSFLVPLPSKIRMTDFDPNIVSVPIRIDIKHIEYVFTPTSEGNKWLVR